MLRTVIGNFRQDDETDSVKFRQEDCFTIRSLRRVEETERAKRLTKRGVVEKANQLC
ncbi:hypothetical protein Patl1_36098 [Pistacia atlantica]|nr:hypothetical protein Patl1_36098 [Pistacia atlantica]